MRRWVEGPLPLIARSAPGCSIGPTGQAGLSTGPAGGVLTGSYPDPSLAAGVVSASKLAHLVERKATVAIDKDFSGVAEVACGLGEVAISGGSFAPAHVHITSSRMVGNGWSVSADNESTLPSAGLTAFVYCLSGP